MNIVYILCPARSGSTFLQFLLSNHEKIVGIGELNEVLKKYCGNTESLSKSVTCSCGNPAKLCLFWGPILKNIDSIKPKDGFIEILQYFKKRFPDKILLDSSKSGTFLEDFYLNTLRPCDSQNIHIKLLFLIRDFRGWSTSIKKHNLRLNRNKIWKNSIIVNSYRWLFTSLKWFRKVQRLNIPFLPVYYENLVFDLDSQLKRIYNFLNLNYLDANVYSPIETHELFGSPSLKSDPEKMTNIVYDTEWMKNYFFFLIGPTLFPPALFNSIYASSTSVSK